MFFFTPLRHEGIGIYRIDGNYLKATKVEVLPGWHKLDIRPYSFSFIAPMGPPLEYEREVFIFKNWT